MIFPNDSPGGQLTDFVGHVILDDVGELHVAGYHGYLVRRLIRVVQRVLLPAPEQQLPDARGVGVVHCADVQWRVARGVARVHVRPVEEQVVQVLHQVVAAGLQQEEEVG